MKAFIAVLSLLALASADQSTHQTIKHGNAPTVHTAIHKPHGVPAAKVISQPHVHPHEVHQPYNLERYASASVAPAQQPHYALGPVRPHVPAVAHGAAHAPVPVHAPVHPAPYHAAPVVPVVKAAPYHAAPVVPVVKAAPYHAAPVVPVVKAAPYHAPAHVVPVAKPAPYHAPAHVVPVVKPAPYHAPAPVVPVVKAAPVHHAPGYHAPAPAAYHEPEYEAAPVYNFQYAVADDYSTTNFAANEQRDNYVTSGEYRVALPDGRTQIVSYTVDGEAGYVADVRYEGEAHYEPYVPKEPAYAAPKHAAVVPVVPVAHPALHI